MSKGNEGRGNRGSWVLAVGFTLLVSAAGCFAQNWTTSCIPDNGLSFPQTGISFISSGDWVPGRTITVQIRGAYPVGLAQPGCTNVTLTAMTWPNYDDPTGYGGPDRYVTVSNLAYVSSTLTTFVVQIADGAPDHWVYMRLEAAQNAGALAGWVYWGALIGPPPPPNQPMPPRTHPTCATPMFALQSPVVPDTWMAGESYPIVIKGTGFTTAAKGTDACPQTQIGVSVTTGSVTLSDVQVLDESTITAIVKPDATDPAETAQVNLYGSNAPILEVAKHSGNATSRASAPKSLDAFPGMLLTDQANAAIIKMLVQAQNVTPTLNLKAEQASITSTALTAHLTLGGTFQIAVGYKKADGTFQSIPSTFSLDAASLTGDLDDNALFPDNAAFQYTQLVNGALVLQATHLGTQQFTITPNDKTIPPVNMLLSIEMPKSLGVAINDPRLLREFRGGLDSALYPLADETGIPPQMIKGQVMTEGRFDPKAWRYEPVNASVGDFAYSWKRDLRTNAHYGSSLRLPTIGDSIDPGNCGTYATTNNVKVIVNGASNSGWSMNPLSAAPGSQFTITGTNFGSSQSAVSGVVTINGVNAVITSWTATSISALVPNYDYTTHVDSRIPDVGCRGWAQGASFSQQVMSDIARTRKTIMIPDRDPSTGAVLTDGNGQPLPLRPLLVSDRSVSVHDIFISNDGKYHWSSIKNAPGPIAQARARQLKSGAVDFTAQLSLAASYGLLQVMYATAIDRKWAGSTPNCGPSNPQDPDYLFDTSCNLLNKGGSLGLGTRITETNFAQEARSTNPSVNGESTLESFFDQAYQDYNANNSGYGDGVIANTKLYEPNPTGSIFNAGGQQ